MGSGSAKDDEYSEPSSEERAYKYREGAAGAGKGSFVEDRVHGVHLAHAWDWR